MDDCRTVMFLQDVAAAGGSMASVARPALRLIEDSRQTELDPIYLTYLHELIEHIYHDSGLPMLDHLRDGADCELCAALVARLPE